MEFVYIFYPMSNLYSLLAGAVADPDGRRGRAKGYQFTIGNGDLNQMAQIKNYLLTQGLDVGSINVYPAVKTKEDLKKGLELLWKNRVAGWWNNEHQFVTYGTCTQVEFREALKNL